MTMSNPFNTFDYAVRLFKSFGDNVSYASGVFKLINDVVLNEEQAFIINEFYNKNKQEKLFRQFKVEINWDEKIEGKIVNKANCTELKIEFDLYNGCSFSFYKDENDLLEKLSTFLIQGYDLPKNYYFIDSDFRSDSDLVHPFTLKLEAVTKWLGFLKSVSDIDKNIDNGVSLYYFIKGEKDKFAKPLEVKITNIKDLLSINALSPVDDIDFLLKADENGNLHHRDKLSFFKLALVDTFRNILAEKNTSSSPAFILFSNLGKIKNAYFEHYDVFIQNFAIGEFQQQVEAKSFEYSEKLSTVLNDIQMKLYAIPIVLIGLSTFDKIEGFSSYLFIVSGVFIAGLFNYWMVEDQMSRLEQIKISISYTFDKLKLKSHDGLHDSDIANNLDNISRNLDDRIKDRQLKIKYYRYFCWLPLMLTIIFIIFKEWEKLNIFNIGISKPTLDDLYVVILSATKLLNYFLF
ncbi:hypothetical protein CKQ84_11820 [Shewanella sp. WE21]|nr:hypothetical protein CKQ84_11820 [Shewanella sp. WE21]